jgi:hypothetical protein
MNDWILKWFFATVSEKKNHSLKIAMLIEEEEGNEAEGREIENDIANEEMVIN